MTPDTFTTQPLRPQDLFEAWRQWHQPVLDFLPQQSTRYGFPAEVHLWKPGGLAMSRTSVPPVRVARTKRNLKRDPIDHWVISYCIRGTHFTNTGGTAVEIPARVPFLSSLGQEFLHERTHIDRVSLLVSRDAFRDIASLLDAAGASSPDTPLGHLLGDYMMALERHLPDVTEADFPRLARAVGAMVAVTPSAERVGVAGPLIDVGRRNGCGGSFGSICGHPLSGRRSSAGSSVCPDPIFIGCSKIAEVSPGTFSVSGCSKRMRSWPILRTHSRSRRSPRICVLETPPPSAVPSNVSSAIARASCGRRRSLGWRRRRRREAPRRRQEQTSASLFEDFSGVTPLAHDRRSTHRGNIRTAYGQT